MTGEYRTAMNIATALELDESCDDASVGFKINLTSVERVLRRTPLVAAGEYRCPLDHPQFAGGGPETCPFIVFPRSSARLIPSRGPAEVCTPNTVNLLDVGDSYLRRPVSREGAMCDWIAVAPELLREMAQAMNPSLDNDRCPIFDRAVAPLGAATFVAQRAFFHLLKHRPTITPLELEDVVLRLIERVLAETHTGSQPPSRQRRRRVGSNRQRETIEDTKCILAREFALPISTAELARRVHCSPWHLSRSFHLATGYTLHGYQMQLRLRAALQLLSETEFNGAGIASQLGFASQSHFSDVFRRKFGMTPSAFVRTCSQASLEYMYAMLDGADDMRR